jgi:glycosyltransferase involved in cell wall biosynthesis
VAATNSSLFDRALADRIDTVGLAMRRDLDLAAAVTLRHAIHDRRVDLVHAHDARAHAIALLALATRNAPPLIVTRRVTFAPKSVRLKYGRRVARFIAISRAVKSAMTTAGVDPARIDIVHSGVQTPISIARRDWRAELGWPADAVVCGVVGAMTSEKGIDTLSHIAQHLSPSAARRARIVLLGGASRDAQKAPSDIGGVEAYAAGFVDDIHDAMAGLDMLWHPASSEGLGTALIDALALGVPPVAFAVGGIPEIIVDGECGLLVSPEDARGFATAAETLIEDSAARERLASAAPSRAAVFSADRMIENTLQVYHSVLSEWRDRARPR